MAAAYFVENDEVARCRREGVEERENPRLDRDKLKLDARDRWGRRLRRLPLLRTFAARLARAAAFDARRSDTLRRVALPDRMPGRHSLRREEQAEDQREDE